MLKLSAQDVGAEHETQEQDAPCGKTRTEKRGTTAICHAEMWYGFGYGWLAWDTDLSIHGCSLTHSVLW